MRINTTKDYTRSNMAALLTALPREEKQWTLDFLTSIMFIPKSDETPKKGKVKVSLSPELSSFMGMGKSDDSCDWKQMKEEYLDERFTQ